MNPDCSGDHFTLPITALQTLRLPNELLILSGQGPFLKIYDGESREPLLLSRIFESCVIHGIAAKSPKQDATRSRTLLIWGGSSARFVELSFGLQDSQERSPTAWVKDRPRIQSSPSRSDLRLAFGPAIDVQDWILDASLGNLAAAPYCTAFLITSHNSLLALDDTVICPHVKIHHLSNGLKTLLYSARLKSQPPASMLVAAGTAFGEVLIWSYNPDKFEVGADVHPRAHQIYTGHEGSIFGVDISDLFSSQQGHERLLASCSDDRSVRIGRLDVNNMPAQLTGGDKGILDDASSSPNQYSLVEAWTHSSRVWDVRFVHLSTSLQAVQAEHQASTSLYPDRPYLVSVGEDVVCRSGDMDNFGYEKCTRIDKYHSGKNIWSMVAGELAKNLAQYSGGLLPLLESPVPNMLDEQLGIFTGGADGCIVSREISKQDRSSAYLQVSFKDLFGTLTVDGTHKPNAIKQYLLVTHSCLLALTDSGHLLRGHFGNNLSGLRRPPLHWDLLHNGNDLNPRPVLSTNSENGLSFVGNMKGDLFVCENDGLRFVGNIHKPISWLTIAGVENSSETCASTSTCCVIIYSDVNKIAGLAWSRIAKDTPQENPSAKPRDTISQRSPTRDIGNASGESCPQPSIASEQPIEEITSNDLELPDGFVPTSARLMPRTGALVLGSRKGAIAIYQHQSYSTPVCIRHVHGANGLTSITELRHQDLSERPSQDFFLTTGREGSYAIHRVITAESDDKLDFETVDKSTSHSGCGIEGAYRVDAADKSDPAGHGGDLILYGFCSTKFVVLNETRQSHVFEMDCAGSHRSWAFKAGLFAWTQARSFNLKGIGIPNHSPIQQGGHGREIKALAISQPHRTRTVLIATGAEDTTIRLFATSSTNSFECIKVLKKHTTGLQHLLFSSCGRYLFSSGGYDELFAWRVRHDVPVVGVGVVLDCAFPKESPDSDLRITSFHVVDCSSTEGGEKEGGRVFIVSAVYSNSMIKIFHHTTATRDAKAVCDLRQRFFYGTNCLTQIQVSGGAFSASTDGHVAFWKSSSKLQIDKQPHRHRIHQNSIKAMNVVDLTPHDRLVITGSDDNAIGLTLVRASQHLQPKFATLLIPHAHAAAVTAICIVSSQPVSRGTRISFLSTSNDQRVKLWNVSIQYDKMFADSSMAAITVERLKDTGTNVADAAAMEIVPIPLSLPGRPRAEDGTRGFEVLVVGVGMEVLHFDCLDMYISL